MKDDAAPRPASLRRILATPIGELLRGRPAPAADEASIVRSAGLPAPLADLALVVTRRTRLRCAERVDVARELTAHFRDGLEAGAPAGALAALFGDPVRAARLIRRAKKRNRSLLWHAWVNAWKAVGAFFILCILLYTVLAFRFFTARPTLSRNLAAELNAPTLAMPESDKAWPLYRQAYLTLPRRPEAIINLAPWPWLSPADTHWAEYTAYVDSAREAVDLVQQAAARPHLGFLITDAFNDNQMLEHGSWMLGLPPFGGGEPPPFAPPSDNPAMIGALLPHLGYMRDFARHLAADGMVALSRGDGDRFVADVAGLTGMASHIAEHPFLISQLVACAISAVASEAVGRALDEHPSALSDAHLVVLAHRLGGTPVEIDTAIETAFFEDTVQRMYSDDGRGGGRLAGGAPIDAMLNVPGYEKAPWRGPLGPLFAAIVADRKELVSEWNRLMTATRAQADAPMWQWTDYPGSALIEEATSRPLYSMRYFPIPMLIPALGKVALTGNTTALRRDGALAAIAIELHRRRHGAYPPSLADLAPGLIPRIPVDRFDGGSLKYAVRQGQATIYSAGRDGDDDGGAPPAAAAGNTKASQWAPPERVRREMDDPADRFEMDGDWVLWPPLSYDADGALIRR